MAVRSFKYRLTDEPTGFVWGIVNTGMELDKLVTQALEKKGIQAVELKVEVLEDA